MAEQVQSSPQQSANHALGPEGQQGGIFPLALEATKERRSFQVEETADAKR